MRGLLPGPLEREGLSLEQSPAISEEYNHLLQNLSLDSYLRSRLSRTTYNVAKKMRSFPFLPTSAWHIDFLTLESISLFLVNACTSLLDGYLYFFTPIWRSPCLYFYLLSFSPFIYLNKIVSLHSSSPEILFSERKIMQL